MPTGRGVQIIAIALCILSLGLSGVVSAQLTASAGRHKLTYAERAEEGDPPEVAVGIAMGAFRGLFVNMLWIRANQLKEEGKYYEAVDLARAITKLQPRFPQVWSFHAWNMAYNISVTTNTPEERWNWVRQGIDLIREEGVVHNPADLVIHKELAWLFLHKVQAYADDAHFYYKLQHAAEWHEILGPPPHPEPGNNNRERRIEQFEEWLTPIVEAPDTLSGVIATNPDVDELVAQLAVLDIEPSGAKMLRNVTRTRAARNSATWPVLQRQADDRFRQIAALVEDPRHADAWEDLLAYGRRRILLEEYNMEPARMLRYTSKYGPLDWRHPAAHSLYWSQKGVEAALLRVEDENRSDYDFINTDRMVVQSVQELWRSGDLWFDYNGMLLNPHGGQPFYLGLPNTAYIPVYGEILEEVVARSWADGLDRAYSSYFAGYENFMKDAIRYLYRRGQKQLAAEMKDELAQFPFSNTNDRTRAQWLAQDIDRFVKAEIVDRVGSPVVAQTEVRGAIQDALLSGLINGDDDIFDNQIAYARQFHAAYLEEQLRENNVTNQGGRMEFLDRRFDFEVGNMFRRLLLTLDLDYATTGYANAPPELKRWAYDDLVGAVRPAFEEATEEGDPDFDVLFPEPEGMEQFRAMVRGELEGRARDIEREAK
ncbi:MAG: hypothetical protein AAFX79_02205 [Planctomycetota bacterium]